MENDNAFSVFAEKELREAAAAKQGDRDRTLQSKHGDHGQDKEPSRPKKSAQEERADHMLQEAEASKARVYGVKGRTEDDIDFCLNQIRILQKGDRGDKDLDSLGCTVMDDNYMLVASHVDMQLKQKIWDHEYIDLARLLRKDKVGSDEEQKMVMVNKGGMSYWVPFSDKGSSINSVTCWNQAFHVFLNIYTTKYPERTSQLIQDEHVIQTAAASYTWENVYLYDREFR